MTRKLPIWLEALGLFMRGTPPFKGKGRVQQWLGLLVRGKGYFTSVTLEGGEQLVLHLDDWIPHRVFLTGKYDIELPYQRWMFQYLRPGMIVLDIGANIGYYTVQFATRVGLTGRVHAFEPVRSTFAILQANIRLNNLCNAFANQLVLDDRIGEQIIYYAGDDNTGSSSLIPLHEDTPGEKVKATTIDQYLTEEMKEKKVDLVKIDVEGAELAVLRGMRKLLVQPDAPLLFVEINPSMLAKQETRPSELIEFLENCGYLPYQITPSGVYRNRNLIDEPLALFAKVELAVSGNL